MKFGFSRFLIIVVGMILLTGCSANNQANPTEHLNREAKTVHNVHRHTKAFRKSLNEQHQILEAEEKCVSMAGGKTSVYVQNLSTKQPVLIHETSQRAASDIKLFIMIEGFHQIKEGRLSLNQPVTIHSNDRVDGTGILANQRVTRLPVAELLKLMIRNSDNIAANALIDQLGGLKPINTEIGRLNCQKTKLRRKMLDYRALQNHHDNVTSAADLGKVLSKMDHRQLLGNPYDGEMLHLLKHNANQTKLPALIKNRTIIFNKTGEFPDYGVQNDAAIVKRGKRAFIVVVLSENGSPQKQIKAMQLLGNYLYSIILAKK